MGTHPIFESDFDCLTEMAWRCSANSNSALVNNLFRSGIIKSEIVRDAMANTDRAHYVASAGLSRAYDDSPLSIGFNATISAPHMHAYALENCLPPIVAASQAGRQPKILDVGCGSGYLLGAFARIFDAHVVGLEHIEALYQMSCKNFKVSKFLYLRTMQPMNRIS